MIVSVDIVKVFDKIQWLFDITRSQENRSREQLPQFAKQHCREDPGVTYCNGERMRSVH